jgi:hypothetical protein
MKKDISKAKPIISFAKILLICYYIVLLGGLAESSGGRIRNFPLSVSFHHGSACLYTRITRRTNSRSAGELSSERWYMPSTRSANMLVFLVVVQFGFFLYTNVSEEHIASIFNHKTTARSDPICTHISAKNSNLINSILL